MESPIVFPLQWPLPTDSFLYFITLDPRCPLIFGLVYFVLATVFSRNNTNRTRPTLGKWTNILILLHNVGLAFFSLAVFWYSSELLVASLQQRSFLETFCDRDSLIWKNGFGFWAWIFYLSKYYEVMDSIIFLVKGKQLSFLHRYHHTGALLSMWIICNGGHISAWTFVSLNSLVHAILYTYYALGTLGHLPSWSRLLTRIQIGHFALGLMAACTYAFIPEAIEYARKVEPNFFAKRLGVSKYGGVIVALTFIALYVIGLTLLFMNFYVKRYQSNHAKEKRD